MEETYNIKGFNTHPKSMNSSMVLGDKYRFTILTERLIRMEYQEDGWFNDNPTQIVINRNFPPCDYHVQETKDNLLITTNYIRITYDKQEFTKYGLKAELCRATSAYRSTWCYGMEIETLKGTARTLDEADGEVELEQGLLSQNGYSVIDDSKSLLLQENGWVKERPHSGIDIYFLGYGREYLDCLKDFYYLCGNVPMIPRYALGNWWSRFHRYSEEEYQQLILEFELKKIPFSVAVIDMDWHITTPDSKYGSGWTGYTWNRELFPDPERFLNWLHKKGLHITLNEHPADGIRAFEDGYKEMAKALGIDYEKEQPIPFDMTNPEFVKAYFIYMHHPNEEIGVDFWWVDWQQGAVTRIPGLDPLWMLNHYHYLNSIRNKKQGMIFSRYAGLGSHRYPVGFSGDSLVTWNSLQFQPYFTATASNVGYGWWSHDIGGHMHGIKDEELQLRWIQFGVFSPIMRLHSSDNPFFDKRPWYYRSDIAESMMKFLRLRHRLVPYLYTMNYCASKHGEPLIQPLYYKYPQQYEAYCLKNEYYFGSMMLACPVTTKIEPSTGLAATKCWLPKGRWFDFFLHISYEGDRYIDFYRDLRTIPVLVKAGAILPLTKEEDVCNQVDNPWYLIIEVYAGADGSFDLYEDNLELETKIQEQVSITNFEFLWGKDAIFTIHTDQNKDQVIPKDRTYEIRFIGVNKPVKLTIDELVEYTHDYDSEQHIETLIIDDSKDFHEIHIRLNFETNEIAENNMISHIYQLLSNAQIEYDLKSMIYNTIKKLEYNNTDKTAVIGELMTMNLNSHLLGAIIELLSAH